MHEPESPQKVWREIGTSSNVAELTAVPVLTDFFAESTVPIGSAAIAVGTKAVLITTSAALVPAILRNSLRVIFFMVIFFLCFINCCNYFGYVSCSFLFNSASESPPCKLLCIYLPQELLLSHSYCCRSAPSCKHPKRCT